MEAVLQVGRGTAVLTSSDFVERGVRFQEDITGRTSSISTDSQSQSTISFKMPSENSASLVAAVTLKNSTDVKVQRASLPRFSWSRGLYSIVLRDFSGKLDILVLNTPNLLMEIHTPRGEQIFITSKGRYSIDASDTRVKVITHDGEAILFAPLRENNRVIPEGMEGVLFAGRNEPVISPTRPNLLENSIFVLDVPIAEQANNLPGRWGCTNLQDAAPRGNYLIDTLEGRSALRLVRADNANSHGETKCQQRFSEVGLDVTGYTFLQLETTFLVNYQSLSECGIRGSECPMMVRISYEDTNGVKQAWIQGFYYASNPSSNYPSRCDTCSQDHRQINEKVWYTFETGNLFSVISSTVRPARITAIEFYSSGHQYDLLVSEVALFAGYVDAVPDVSGQ